MKKITRMNFVVLCPISVLTIQLLHVIARFPSNHSGSPYALVPIWLGTLAVCLFASIFFRRILWVGVAICLFGLSFVWLFDVFNIWVDYDVYCQRGLPTWGSLGTRGIPQFELTFQLCDVLLPTVLWIVLVGSFKLMNRLSEGARESLSCKFKSFVAVLSFVSFFYFLLYVGPFFSGDEKDLPIYAALPWFVCLLILDVVSSVVRRRFLWMPIAVNVMAIVLMVVCDCFNFYVIDSVWTERGCPSSGTFGWFGHHQLYFFETACYGIPCTLWSVLGVALCELFVFLVRKVRNGPRNATISPPEQ